MRIVSDTSPISNLAIIGRLEFLRRLHGTILIAPAVRDELSRLQHSEARALIEAALADGWLKVEAFTAALPVNEHLHPGESESIALTESAPDRMLLIDETEGRTEARRRGLSVTGAIGVLIAARNKNWIPALKPELLALRDRARFFISESLFAAALAAVGEQP